MNNSDCPSPEPQPITAQWANKNEVALHLRCSPRHVNNLMRCRVLPHVKIGRFVRFDLAACDQAMKHYQIQSLYR
jgi:hypothetical protein